MAEMKLTRMRSTIARPADNTVYAAGDEISNHATAGSVVRATWNMAGFTRGRILAAEIDFTAASGNVVTTASDFELLIFKTADVPNAVGDNVTHPIAAATRALAVARFRFDDTGWTGPLGTVAAGTSQVQAVMATMVQPLATNVLEYPWPAGFPFDFTGQADSAAYQFTAVLRALAGWTPTGVINTFGITLDLELYY
jgi:hypothetical protein